MNSQIGIIIKRKRREKGLTLAQLAEKTGFSVSYLSLLEHGKNNPTVESLNKICYALDIMLSELISKLETSPAVIVRKQDRTCIHKSTGFAYESTTDGNHSLSCMVMTVSDNKIHQSTPHITDEIGYVLKGTITFFVSNEQYTLTEGDCIYIEANNSHGYQKVGKDVCECLWFSHIETHSDILTK